MRPGWGYLTDISCVTVTPGCMVQEKKKRMEIALIWKKFTIETSVEAEDLVAEYLEELGFPGAEITDQVPLTEEEMKQMYVDVPLIPEGETETAQVSI